MDADSISTASFAADVDPKTAAFMADSQVPWGVGALSGTISEPAWKAKPSWYLVAADDKMIPPPAQRLMSQRAGSIVVEVAGSHAIYVSNPSAVASLIEKAALHISSGATQAKTAARQPIRACNFRDMPEKSSWRFVASERLPGRSVQHGCPRTG